ncbi:MAG: hypothetical protein WCY97_05770 [Methanothrix sp.]|nr:hypothetical protein [Methanothrix harundinacea]MDD2637444.1 hypothetical protein [Methanothrix sp.]MDD3709196.1 hypothetical protein [Methanothrix sp.]MDD5767036.1 hypothetical protein [Methanothrix sp.]MDI9399832.1 hypothetical protein [Euryarchaeota archaeon]
MSITSTNPNALISAIAHEVAAFNLTEGPYLLAGSTGSNLKVVAHRSLPKFSAEGRGSIRPRPGELSAEGEGDNPQD